MLRSVYVFALGASLIGYSMAQQEVTPPDTVKSLDIQSYAGMWYQIADYVQGYETFCKDCTTVNYTPQSDGSITVENASRNKILGLIPCKITGNAVVTDPAEPGQLKVSFSIPLPVPGFKPLADYWILEVGAKNADNLYSYAIVSNPQKKSFYLLARTPTIDESLYSGLIQKYSALGYDASKIVKSNQDGCTYNNI